MLDKKEYNIDLVYEFVSDEFDEDLSMEENEDALIEYIKNKNEEENK
jgi:tRNA splicing ligase